MWIYERYDYKLNLTCVSQDNELSPPLHLYVWDGFMHRQREHLSLQSSCINELSYRVLVVNQRRQMWEEGDVMRKASWIQTLHCPVLQELNPTRWLFSDRPWSLTCFWMSNKERELLCHSRTSFGLLSTVNGCISVLAWSKTVKFLWSTSRLHRGGLADRWFGFPEPNPRFTLC